MNKHLPLIPACLLLSGVAFSVLGAESSDAEIWDKLRANLFQDRPIIENADSVVQLEAPVRAEDAAVVPISIKTQIVQSPDKYIKKLYLIVDKNPSPLGALFTLTPDSGRADIDTRIRVEQYSFIRAIAEMNDGKLYMAARYIKASGGCSAPAGKDMEEAMARLGKMKFRVENDVVPNQPNQAQLMISHPQVSGLGMDQVTRLYPPAHFVRSINVTYAGKPIISADVDFSISENPNFRFYFVPGGVGELKADVVDSKDLKFENSMRITPGTAATASGS